VIPQYFYPRGVVMQDIKVEKKGEATGAHLDFEISFPGLAIGTVMEFGVQGPGLHTALAQPSAPTATDIAYAAKQAEFLGAPQTSPMPAEAPTPEQQPPQLPSSAAAAPPGLPDPGCVVQLPSADPGTAAITASTNPGTIALTNHFKNLCFHRQLAHLRSNTEEITAMPRGSDPQKNLTWLCVGYDDTLKEYPKAQLFDNGDGQRCFQAETRELALKANTATKDALSKTLEPHVRSILEATRNKSPPPASTTFIPCRTHLPNRSPFTKKNRRHSFSQPPICQTPGAPIPDRIHPVAVVRRNTFANKSRARLQTMLCTTSSQRE
jgi:hypothetical protein